MKILKIVLILLVPAMGIVGCKKSECNPEKHSSSGNASSDNANAGAKSTELIVEEETITTIVGSGDDDRDGGDKKVKKTR